MLFTVGGVQIAGAQTSGPFETRLRVYPLEILLNGAPVGIWPIVEKENLLYAPPEAFEAWRVQRPSGAQQLEFKGLTYFSLASLAGAEFKLDAQQNTLALDVRADAFLGARMKREGASALPRDTVVPSLFLNYDLSYNHIQLRDAPASRALGMLGELGYSSSWGLLTNSFAARNLIGGAPGEGPKLLRLETTLRRDFPDQGYTVHSGDAVTRTGYLGRPTLFGGFQIGTNFGLAPHLNRQPLPVVMGQTLAPSTVQLYVNDVLRQTARVPAGPFTLDTLPAITGNGEVSVVVRDILGRETVITQPFVISADLLAPGLNDWSLEAGKLRQDLGSSNSRYGDAFTGGMWRRGMTRTLTVEGRAELSRNRSLLGIAGVWALGRNYLARGGLTASRDRLIGSGQRWSIGLDWQGKVNSALVNVEGNSRALRHLAESLATVPSRLQLAAQAGFFIGRYGRIGTGFAVQLPHDAPRVATASVSYSTVLKDNWQLSMSLSRAFGAARGTTLGVSVSIPLSKRNSSTSSAQFRQGQVDAYTSVSHTPEGVHGTSWRVLGGYQTHARAEASLYHFGERGIASGEISTTTDDVNVRLGATGALLYTSAKVFALPRHDMSAALVVVPGYPGVGVGLGQQVSTRTDAEGYALIPRLNAYQSNPIRLDANDLPITAEIDSIELPAIPDWRSVSRISFPVRGGRGALVRIVLDDGHPAPTGATVRIAGEDRAFYVSRRGEAYVTGLKQRNRLRLGWNKTSCDLEFELPAGSVDEIARVGPITCIGAVQR